MQPSLAGHLVVELFTTSLPELTHLESQRWNAFHHRAWEGETNQAWSVDRNNIGHRMGSLFTRRHSSFWVTLLIPEHCLCLYRPSFPYLSASPRIVSLSPKLQHLPLFGGYKIKHYLFLVLAQCGQKDKACLLTQSRSRIYSSYLNIA